MHQATTVAMPPGQPAPQRPRYGFFAAVGCLSLLVGLLLGVGGFFAVRALQDGEGTGPTTPVSSSPVAPLVLDETPFGQENAVPLGTTFPVRSVTLHGNPAVTPVSVDWDATSAVAEANSYNDAPAAGNKLILLSLTGTLDGDGPDSTLLASWIHVRYVEPDGTEHEQFWAVGPNYDTSIASAGAAEDGSYTDEFCFEVPEGTEPGGHFVFGDGMGSLDGWTWVTAA